MKDSIKTGISFGLTSGTITTLGLMTGLSVSTHSKAAVIGGILTIAIADSFSDALGIHVAQESQNGSNKSVWESTGATYITKLIYGLTFAIPVIIFELSTAIWINIGWGIGVLAIFSYLLSRKQENGPWGAVFEHVSVGILVLIVTYNIGTLIDRFFN